MRESLSSLLTRVVNRQHDNQSLFQSSGLTKRGVALPKHLQIQCLEVFIDHQAHFQHLQHPPDPFVQSLKTLHVTSHDVKFIESLGFRLAVLDHLAE